jgi:hypothetical protein
MMDSTSIVEEGVVVKVWGVELKGVLLRLAQARNEGPPHPQLLGNLAILRR